MKTRFQRLSFAVGLSLLSGAITGKIFQMEYCIYDGEKFGCNYMIDQIKSGEAIKISEYNTVFGIVTYFAVLGLCLIIIAFIKEDKE
jgi:hypothetical protein